MTIAPATKKAPKSLLCVALLVCLLTARLVVVPFACEYFLFILLERRITGIMLSLYVAAAKSQSSL